MIDLLDLPNIWLIRWPKMVLFKVSWIELIESPMAPSWSSWPFISTIFNALDTSHIWYVYSAVCKSRFLVFRYYLTFDWCYFGTSGTPSFLSFPKHITYFLFCLIFRWRVNAWSCVALINLAEKNAWVFLWPRCGTFLSLVSLVWFNPGVQSSRPPSATFEQGEG